MEIRFTPRKRSYTGHDHDRDHAIAPKRVPREGTSLLVLGWSHRPGLTGCDWVGVAHGLGFGEGGLNSGDVDDVAKCVTVLYRVPVVSLTSLNRSR